MEGSGVVLITLMVPVDNFSAAPRDAELARAKATIADNLSFINIKPDQVDDCETLSKLQINFNELEPEIYRKTSRRKPPLIP